MDADTHIAAPVLTLRDAPPAFHVMSKPTGGGAFERMPDHVMGVIMPSGKFAQYAYWHGDSTQPDRRGMEF